MPPLLLASASPRRRQFLLELGFEFRLVPTHLPEDVRQGEAAEEYVVRIARAKAQAAPGDVPAAVVLAADTAVVVDGEVLGKPVDEADFRRMMQLLGGRTHEVMSAVAVRKAGETRHRLVRSRVTFRSLGDAEMSWYWATGEPQDKAGGYALQGRGGAFVTSMEGSHSNVIGLPLVETLELLEAAGVPPPWQAPRKRR